MKRFITLSFLTLLCHFASYATCPILGTLGVCLGGTSSLYISDSTFMGTDSLCLGGTWASSTTSVATVSSGGIVTGVSLGIATISYTSMSGLTTVTVTVSPSPASITGASSVCVGSTIVLTDATPGGVWSSSSSYYASVGSTGVVTGNHAGTVYIYYTLAGGCSVSRMITVSSTFSTFDSLSGPSWVCAGGTTTLTSSVSGGTWSSSNPTVATINPSTGLVTGVSTGTTFLTYTVIGGACGTSYIVDSFTVNPPAYAGYIYGASSTIVGGTVAVYDYSASGTWASSNPSIASVDAFGNVTGVSAGTVNIEYIVNGCTTSDTAIYPFTVTALDGIAGNVFFASGYYGNVKVWLITFNTGTLDLEAVDSTTVYCSGTSVGYSFTGAATDSYRVKAALAVDSFGTDTGYVPTYHDSSYHWNTATVIHHVSGTADVNKNVYMHAGVYTSGTGFISGNVMSGADKGTSGGVPVANMLIYVVNQATGVEVERTYTDVSGNYSFSNLPVGNTYLIYPEAINYATTVYASITLTTGAPSMTAASFIQHTVSKTITPIPASVSNITNTVSTVSIFPNPTTGKLNLQWNVKTTEKGIVTVSDMAGKALYQTNVDLSTGSGCTQLDLSSIANGMYLVNIKSASINYNAKVLVNKQ